MNFDTHHDFADVMTKDEWIASVKVGAFIPSDGDGYWGTETHFSYDAYAFKPAPSEATHVHWFNK